MDVEREDDASDLLLIPGCSSLRASLHEYLPNLSLRHKNVVVEGFTLHVVEQWLTAGVDQVFTVVCSTGKATDTIVCDAYEISGDKIEVEEVLKKLTTVLATRRETKHGYLMVTPLSSLKADIVMVWIPDGDIETYWDNLTVSINLRRMGCSGTELLPVKSFNSAVQSRFYSSYHIPPPIFATSDQEESKSFAFQMTVMDVAKLLQTALKLYGMLEHEEEGLLDDLTLEALHNWGLDFNPVFWAESNSDPNGVTPRTLSKFLSTTWITHCRLQILQEKSPEDPFVPGSEKSYLAHVKTLQNKLNIQETGKMDVEYVARLKYECEQGGSTSFRRILKPPLQLLHNVGDGIASTGIALLGSVSGSSEPTSDTSKEDSALEKIENIAIHPFTDDIAKFQRLASNACSSASGHSILRLIWNVKGWKLREDESSRIQGRFHQLRSHSRFKNNIGVRGFQRLRQTVADTKLKAGQAVNGLITTSRQHSHLHKFGHEDHSNSEPNIKHYDIPDDNYESFLPTPSLHISSVNKNPSRPKEEFSEQNSFSQVCIDDQEDMIDNGKPNFGRRVSEGPMKTSSPYIFRIKTPGRSMTPLMPSNIPFRDDDHESPQHAYRNLYQQSNRSLDTLLRNNEPSEVMSLEEMKCDVDLCCAIRGFDARISQLSSILAAYKMKEIQSQHVTSLEVLQADQGKKHSRIQGLVARSDILSDRIKELDSRDDTIISHSKVSEVTAYEMVEDKTRMRFRNDAVEAKLSELRRSMVSLTEEVAKLSPHRRQMARKAAREMPIEQTQEEISNGQRLLNWLSRNAEWFVARVRAPMSSFN